MTGRVIIVTGANSGIGFETAKYLAEGGNDLILACRDEEKGEDAVRKIKMIHPNALVKAMQLDLSSLMSVKSFVKEFMQTKRKLNVLINNAGMALNFNDGTLQTTSDGFEITMATNHFGPFLLIQQLLDLIIQTGNVMGDSRIINVTCPHHDSENYWLTENLDYLDAADNLQLLKPGTFNGLQAYKNSKLCNLLTTYKLAERLKGEQHISVNAVDPGLAPTTRLGRNASRFKRALSVFCLHHALRCTHITTTVKQAALQIVNLAISERYEGVSGKFFRKGEEDRSSVESYDPDLQNMVWKQSCKLVQFCSSAVSDDDRED